MRYMARAVLSWVAAAIPTALLFLVAFGTLHSTRGVIPIEDRSVRALLIAGLIVVSFALWLWHIRYAEHLRTYAHVRRGNDIEIDDDAEPGEPWDWTPFTDQRAFLTRAIAGPRDIFSRITESLSYVGRSLRLTTAITINVPAYARGQDLVVPVLFQRRGRLVDGLQVTDQEGVRISTVSREHASVLLNLMTDELIAKLFIAAGPDDGAAQIELRRLAGSIIDAPTGREGASTYTTFTDLMTRLRPRLEAEFADTLLVLLGRLTRVYPILVVCNPTDREKPSSVLPATRRISVARSSAPHYGNRPQDRTLPPSRLRAFLEGFGRIRFVVRAIFGVREPEIRFPLDNADRAASYHAHVNAPEDMYVASSEVRWAWNGAELEETRSAKASATRPKDGQPIAHFYALNGSGFSGSDFVTTFRESPPGSAGEAVISAAAVSALLIAVYLVNGASAFLSILAPLAFAGLGTGSIWRGVVHTRIPFGGEFSARLSSIVTMIIALLSLAVSALSVAIAECAKTTPSIDCSDFIGKDDILAMAVASLPPYLIVASCLNLVFIAVSWTINIQSEMRLVNSGERARPE